MAVKFERRTAADGHIVIPAKIVKNIQVFVFWAMEHVHSGQQLIAADFTPQTLLEAKESMWLREENKQHGRRGRTGRGCRVDSRHVAAVSNEEVSAVMESTELPPALQDIPTLTSTSAPTITTTDGSSMKGSTNGNNFRPGAYRK